MSLITKKICGIVILSLLILFLPQVSENKETDSTFSNHLLLQDIINYVESVENNVYNIQRATIYHAVPWQTNKDNLVTASGFRLNPNFDHQQYRILAVSRDLLVGHFSYGDSVLVTGTGRFDGIWRIEDTMNVRFTNTIDFLVDLDIRGGLYSDVKLIALNNK